MRRWFRFANLLAVRRGGDRVGRLGDRQGGVEFEVTLDPAVAPQAVSGRLYVFLSQRPVQEPRDGPNWFAPEPFFGIDVKDFQPGTARRVNDAADGFPDRLSKLPPGKYRAQALLGHNPDLLSQSRAPGNVFSRVVEVEFPPGRCRPLRLCSIRSCRPKSFRT